MNTAKQMLHRLVEEIPENQLPEIIDFICFLKQKNEKQQELDLQEASSTSMDFWENTIDDEVWNHV